MVMVVVMVKVLEWKCKTCGKVIRSLYVNQLEANKKEHLRKHENVV